MGLQTIQANKLDAIIADQRTLVSEQKRSVGKISVEQLVKLECPRNLRHFLQDSQNKFGYGIIAEYKRKSPAHGNISNRSIVSTLGEYERGGAAAISMLTNSKYFGGEIEFIKIAKQEIALPVLRKDFIIDSWQIYQSRLHEADAILLIVAALPQDKLSELIIEALSLEMGCLIELHDEQDLSTLLYILKSLPKEIKGNLLNTAPLVVGINNRDLRTFKTDLDTSRKMLKICKQEFAKINCTYPIISESAINSADIITELIGIGAAGFLIGEYLMRSDKPSLQLELIRNQVVAQLHQK